MRMAGTSGKTKEDSTIHQCLERSPTATVKPMETTVSAGIFAMSGQQQLEISPKLGKRSLFWPFLSNN